MTTGIDPMGDLRKTLLASRGKEAYQRKDFLLALDLFHQAAEAQGASSSTSLSLCTVLAALGRWDDSLASAQQVRKGSAPFRGASLQ